MEITTNPEAEMTITRTFNGSHHTGYTITNEHGATAEVYESKSRGYFVRAEDSLTLVTSLLAARDLAIDLLA